MRLSYRIVLALMLAVSLAGLLPSTTPAAPLDGYELPDDVVEARYVEIIDGDTFIAEVYTGGRWREETIRMIGIDTPETSYSYGNEPECYGNEATRYADSILNAAP